MCGLAGPCLTDNDDHVVVADDTQQLQQVRIVCDTCQELEETQYMYISPAVYLVSDSKYWQELSLLFDTLALSKRADCLALRLDMGGELLARLVVSGTILSLSGVL